MMIHDQSFASAGTDNERAALKYLSNSNQDRQIQNEEWISVMWNFLQDEQGQDLIEYTLLLAFVALASASLFITAGSSVNGIWTKASSRLAAANTSAS
jgi:Flp pilus assembly pilin Flp